MNGEGKGVADPFAMGRCGGSPETATAPVSRSTNVTIQPRKAAARAMRAGRSYSSVPAKASFCALATATPCSSGAGSSTTAASWELTAQSFETKARRSRHSLSDRLTLSLITSGLVSGITPTSIRQRCGAPIPATVSWRRDGGDAAAATAGSRSPSEGFTSSNGPDTGRTLTQPQEPTNG